MGSFFQIQDTLPPENRREMLDFFWNIFRNNNPLVVEIGSGNGHFLVDYAKSHPEYNFIGVEILMGRAKKFYSKIVKRSLQNIAVFRGDARRFLWEYLYEESVQEFIFLFPDPWPKKRHHKHRLLNTQFIPMLETRLIKGGLVSIATDFCEYRDWILNEFKKIVSFKNLFKNGYSTYPHDYPGTLFEERFRKSGKGIYYMQFIKHTAH